MRRMKLYVLYMFMGGGVYWITDIAIQWSFRGTKIWIILLTFFVPVVVTGTFFLIRRSSVHIKYRYGLPLFMLFGIWLFGPLAIAIGVQAHGGTFFSTGNVTAFFMLWAIFPMSTFVMSTYSGSLGGLLITSVLLLIFAGINGFKHYYSGSTRHNKPRN